MRSFHSLQNAATLGIKWASYYKILHCKMHRTPVLCYCMPVKLTQIHFAGMPSVKIILQSSLTRAKNRSSYSWPFCCLTAIKTKRKRCQKSFKVAVASVNFYYVNHINSPIYSAVPPALPLSLLSPSPWLEVKISRQKPTAVKSNTFWWGIKNYIN